MTIFFKLIYKGTKKCLKLMNDNADERHEKTYNFLKELKKNIFMKLITNVFL